MKEIRLGLFSYHLTLNTSKMLFLMLPYRLYLNYAIVNHYANSKRKRHEKNRKLYAGDG